MEHYILTKEKFNLRVCNPSGFLKRSTLISQGIANGAFLVFNVDTAYTTIWRFDTNSVWQVHRSGHDYHYFELPKGREKAIFEVLSREVNSNFSVSQSFFRSEHKTTTGCLEDLSYVLTPHYDSSDSKPEKLINKGKSLI